MKAPSPSVLTVGLIGVAILTLLAIGAPTSRKAPPPISETSEAPPASSVSHGNFTLASTSVDLPIDEATYPDGPHADVVNANCTSCHSTSMVLTQPRLTADQWKATVTKMREVYKAPIADDDVAAIIMYLTAIQRPNAENDSGEGNTATPKAARSDLGTTS